MVTTCLAFGGVQQVLSLFFLYTQQEYTIKTNQNGWLILLYLHTFRR